MELQRALQKLEKISIENEHLKRENSRLKEDCHSLESESVYQKELHVKEVADIKLEHSQ